MKTSMLDYCKMILSKVQFDKNLYVKEYIKSLTWLSESEREELKKWHRKYGIPFVQPS